MTTLGRPDATEYAHYYERYIALIPDGDIASILERQRDSTAAMLAGLSEDQGNYRYAPDKWILKDVVCHVTDTERVFSYRAVHFARGDETPLPSFDEKVWAPQSGAAARTLKSLTDELVAVRNASLALIRSLTPEQAMRRGVASGMEVSVRALAWKMAGHMEHHVHVLKERYLRTS